MIRVPQLRYSSQAPCHFHPQTNAFIMENIYETMSFFVSRSNHVCLLDFMCMSTLLILTLLK